ncbi:unnamed protein product, partial [marine sediment metagenome]
MELILPMLFLELGFVFMFVGLALDKFYDYGDLVSIMYILSVVVFLIGGYSFFAVTETTMATVFNETSGQWVNNTAVQAVSEYRFMTYPCIGLAFFSLTLF